MLYFADGLNIAQTAITPVLLELLLQWQWLPLCACLVIHLFLCLILVLRQQLAHTPRMMTVATTDT